MIHFILVLFLTSNPPQEHEAKQRIVSEYLTWQECEAAGKNKLVDPYKGFKIKSGFSGTVYYRDFPTDYKCEPLSLARPK